MARKTKLVAWRLEAAIKTIGLWLPTRKKTALIFPERELPPTMDGDVIETWQDPVETVHLAIQVDLSEEGSHREAYMKFGCLGCLCCYYCCWL